MGSACLLCEAQGLPCYIFFIKSQNNFPQTHRTGITMSISFNTFSALQRVFTPNGATGFTRANTGMDDPSASNSSSPPEPSTTVTLSNDGMAFAKLASEGVATTLISGPNLSQLVQSGQIPLIKSPGAQGGSISQEDFEQLVLQAGGTKQQADQLFSTIDTDGNGSVSSSEVLSGISKDGDGSSIAQTLRSLMDTNNDGTVSGTEFVKFETNLISAEKPVGPSAA
jgi:hypothetical protein